MTSPSPAPGQPAPDRPVAVAVQGELGCNSELAAHQYFDAKVAVDIVTCTSFADLFEAQASGAAQYAMAPVENSLAGGVHPVWDLLLEHRPPVAGELLLRISHCLITHPGADLGDLTDVYSHPQALAQCARYLSSLEGVRQHEVYDTAGAVKMIAERQVRGEAAIASAQAAADYGMPIAMSGIETEHENYTRFLVLGEGAAADGASCDATRTSVIAPLGEGARDLAAMLAALTARNLEVAKVECVKRLGRPWDYVAFVDFASGLDQSGSAAALAQMQALCPGLCTLGPYPAGRRAEPGLRPAPSE